MQPFISPKFFFGVFAVLSNSIEVPRAYSIVKNTDADLICYVTRLDMRNQCFQGRGVPITGDSVEEKVEFSSYVLPSSILSFSSSLFPDYTNLILFFKSVFIVMLQSYSGETLVFDVISCISE